MSQVQPSEMPWPLSEIADGPPEGKACRLKPHALRAPHALRKPERSRKPRKPHAVQKRQVARIPHPTRAPHTVQKQQMAQAPHATRAPHTVQEQQVAQAPHPTRAPHTMQKQQVARAPHPTRAPDPARVEAVDWAIEAGREQPRPLPPTVRSTAREMPGRCRRWRAHATGHRCPHGRFMIDSGGE